MPEKLLPYSEPFIKIFDWIYLDLSISRLLEEISIHYLLLEDDFRTKLPLLFEIFDFIEEDLSPFLVLEKLLDIIGSLFSFRTFFEVLFLKGEKGMFSLQFYVFFFIYKPIEYFLPLFFMKNTNLVIKLMLIVIIWD